jgi:hypothetical protein
MVLCLVNSLALANKGYPFAHIGDIMRFYIIGGLTELISRTNTLNFDPYSGPVILEPFRDIWRIVRLGYHLFYYYARESNRVR